MFPCNDLAVMGFWKPFQIKIGAKIWNLRCEKNSTTTVYLTFQKEKQHLNWKKKELIFESIHRISVSLIRKGKDNEWSDERQWAPLKKVLRCFSIV